MGILILIELFSYLGFNFFPLACQISWTFEWGLSWFWGIFAEFNARKKYSLDSFTGKWTLHLNLNHERISQSVWIWNDQFFNCFFVNASDKSVHGSSRLSTRFLFGFVWAIRSWSKTSCNRWLQRYKSYQCTHRIYKVQRKHWIFRNVTRRIRSNEISRSGPMPKLHIDLGPTSSFADIVDNFGNLFGIHLEFCWY